MPQNDHITQTDQLGRNIEIPFPPKRIVSVVPSQTELLFDLGVGDSVVGTTWFCVHPEDARKKTPVGGTKNLKLEKIASQHPDLILANKEENNQQQIEWLAERFPVWISDIRTLEDAIEMIRNAGEMTGKKDEANDIIFRIKASLQIDFPIHAKRTLYLIWKDPYMSTGTDTFISSVMKHLGFINVIATETRYPELSIEDIKLLNPELVMLSSEPFPFKEKHIRELKNILPDTKVVLVNGEMFSWYGSRLIEAGNYFKNELLIPDF